MCENVLFIDTVFQVVLIIGIAGACRSHELTDLTVDDVVDKDDILIVHIRNTKNHKQRTFTVCNAEKENAMDAVSICKKYFNLRPKNMNSKRLFVKYYNGKCAAQNIGLHTMGTIPSKIAAYLNLPHAKDFTGHCFRRTSATLLADSGADILTLKRHGGWKSTNVAEGYVEDSIQNKVTIARKILNIEKPKIVTKNVTETSLILDSPPQVQNSCTPLVLDSPSQVQNSSFTKNIEMPDLSKQNVSFSNCVINNPVFNVNISN